MTMDEQYLVTAYLESEDVLTAVRDRFEERVDALHQKAIWERDGAEEVSMQLTSDRLHAVEEGECLLCTPEDGENDETHTTLHFLDSGSVPRGENPVGHLVEIPVCERHYEAFEQYQRGKNVPEVDA